MLKNRFSLSILLGLFFLNALFAQLDNSGLEQKLQLDTGYNTPYTFNLRALGFNKNNEYYNGINKGYTLFGYRIIPSIGWQLNPKLKLEGGVFLQQDFGSPNLTYYQPYFNILYSFDNNQLIFGNINGSIHHRLIEPLEDFERLLFDNPERGLQFIRETDKLFLDAWIDWERIIYPASDFKELIAGGLVNHYKLINKPQKKLDLIYQFKGFHRGGQIDTINNLPLIIVFNNSIGASYERNFGGKHFNSVKFEGHLLHFADISPQPTAPYTEGYGYYLNASISGKLGTVMLSYWRGDHFYAYNGGRIYQSVSTNFESRYFEDVRELLILRIMNEFSLGKSTNLLLRFEPFWDFQNRKFEFSHAIYFNIFKTIPIGKK